MASTIMPQYSVRTMLVAISLACLVFALLSWRLALGLCISGCAAGTAVAVISLAKRRLGFAFVGGIIALVLALTIYVDLSGRVYWSGQFTMLARLTVLDAETDSPLPNASVCIDYANDMGSETDITTNALGTANYSEDWYCGGQSSGLGMLFGGEPYSVNLRRYALTVSADGYEPYTATLDVLTGRDRIPGHPANLQSLDIRLRRKGQPKAEMSDK